MTTMTNAALKRIQQKMRVRFGRYILNMRYVPMPLGFRKSGNNIVDTLEDGLEIEYNPRTDIGKALFLRGSFEENEILFF